jgi:hypothetical protein
MRFLDALSMAFAGRSNLPWARRQDVVPGSDSGGVFGNEGRKVGPQERFQVVRQRVVMIRIDKNFQSLIGREG